VSGWKTVPSNRPPCRCPTRPTIGRYFTKCSGCCDATWNRVSTPGCCSSAAAHKVPLQRLGCQQLLPYGADGYHTAGREVTTLRGIRLLPCGARDYAATVQPVTTLRRNGLPHCGVAGYHTAASGGRTHAQYLESSVAL